MEIILHRINTIEGLRKIPLQYGVEIDVREDLKLSHDPTRYVKGSKLASLKNYLKEYDRAGHKGTIVFNIKATGIEEEVMQLAAENNIENYFLLDVEMPYLYKASLKGVNKMAVRYSEYEPIQFVDNFRGNGSKGGKLDWVWIDSATELPLDKDIVKRLEGFKTCLVSPDRWGRPEDIPQYIKQMSALSFKLDAVMTEYKYAHLW